MCLICAPMKAANATSDAIQANSSTVGTADSGESVNVVSCSFGPTGDVQPSVVPTAKLDRFTVCPPGHTDHTQITQHRFIFTRFVRQSRMHGIRVQYSPITPTRNWR